MNEGPIEIIFAGDRKMVKGVFLCLLTVAHYTKKAVNVHFLTMTVRTKKFKGDAVTEEDLAFLKNYFGHGEYPMTFEAVNVGPLYKKTLGGTANENTGFTPYTLLRLFAPDLLKMDHALYLDADIMTSSSLEPLWDIDISDYELAGVIDHIGKYWMPKGYFNAGVMDLNLKAIRESHLFEKSIVYVAHHFLFMPDQTAVNRLVKKSFSSKPSTTSKNEATKMARSSSISAKSSNGSRSRASLRPNLGTLKRFIRPIKPMFSIRISRFISATSPLSNSV
jgi:lipopolysaccharide biosynthesis glycosyltransferase